MFKSSRALVILLAFLLVTTVGCGDSRQTSGQPRPEEDGPPLIAQEFSLKSASGGTAQLNLGDGSRVKIVFPQDSLQSDATLSIAPRYAEGDDILSGGFSLTESGADQGPALKYPAIIFFYADKDMGQDVSIVRYQADGSYEVIPTTVTVANGQTALMAQVDHFSEYGAKKITPAEKESARDQEIPDFNWVIYVQDSADVNMGAMKRKIMLDFKAVNTSGYVHGIYQGYARAKTTNDMEAMGGKLDADFEISDESVSFALEPYEKLAPLVPQEEPAEMDPALAPLVPPDEDDLLAPLVPEGEGPDMSASGTLNMKGAGSGTIQIGAYGGSRSLKAQDSSDPFELTVIGSQVRLSVNITGIGTVYFDGYIRGEGR